MEKAKREFLQMRAGMHPSFVSEAHPTDGGFSWDLALYVRATVVLEYLSSPPVNGWTPVYRVTHAPGIRRGAQSRWWQ